MMDFIGTDTGVLLLFVPYTHCPFPLDNSHVKNWTAQIVTQDGLDLVGCRKSPPAVFSRRAEAQHWIGVYRRSKTLWRFFRQQGPIAWENGSHEYGMYLLTSWLAAVLLGRRRVTG